MVDHPSVDRPLGNRPLGRGTPSAANARAGGSRAPEEDVAKPEGRRGSTGHGAGLGRARTAVYHRPHTTPQHREEAAVRNNAPTPPDPPWVFAVAGLLASLSIGLVAAASSHLASLKSPKAPPPSWCPGRPTSSRRRCSPSRGSPWRTARGVASRGPSPWACCPAWRSSPPTTGRSDGTTPVRVRGVLAGPGFGRLRPGARLPRRPRDPHPLLAQRRK